MAVLSLCISCVCLGGTFGGYGYGLAGKKVVYLGDGGNIGRLNMMR